MRRKAEMTAAEYQATETEAEFQAWVSGVARDNGWLVFHFPNMVGNPAGFPDLLMLRGDRYKLVELKTARGKLGPKQEEMLEVLKLFAAGASVWRPVDKESIPEWLK